MHAEARRRWRWRLWAERLLVGTGIACMVWAAAVSLHATRYQRQQRAALERMHSPTPPMPSAPSDLSTGSLIGSLDIPRLRLSAVVAEGDDDATLAVAVGHLPDTPLPWHDGNTALAGHRDTFFRSLRGIRIGDEVRLRTAHGDFTYRVQDTLVVGPDEVRVLDPTDQPTLTLITCHPFSYLGPAPRRFIVRAERIAAAAATLREGSSGSDQDLPSPG